MQVRGFTVGPFQENTYLLWQDGSDRAVLIDPGAGKIMAFNAPAGTGGGMSGGSSMPSGTMQPSGSAAPSK